MTNPYQQGVISASTLVVLGIITSQPASAFSFAFENFGIPAPSLITTNGDAEFTNDVLRLTPDEGSKLGSAFFNAPFDFDSNTSFSTQFQFLIHGQRAGTTEGGDGLVFIIQNDPRGVNALGTDGSGLGYGNGGLFGESPITNSVAIAFDTFPFQLNNQGSIELLQNGSTNPLIQSIQPLDFAIGSPLNAWIDYDGNTDLLEVFLSLTTTKPSSPLLSNTLAIDSIVGEQAFFGFSAATGARFNTHDIESWKLTTVVPEPTSLLGLIAFGALSTGSVLKRKQEAVKIHKRKIDS